MLARAHSPAEIAEVKELFLEYAESLDFDLCFQGFDEEMAGFPGQYAPPAGSLLLARVDGGAAAGAVGLRPLTGGACEMKRLYVRPRFRGLGLGRELVLAILEEGRRRDYAVMRLDSLPSMAAAIGLYREFGFREIAPYTHNPIPGVIFLECGLS